MKIKKILCASILVAMILSSFACSDTQNSSTDNNQNNGDTVSGEISSGNSEESDDERIYPDLPERDFGGHEFKIIHWYLGDWESTVREYRDLTAESLNGETINDAVYNRNAVISDRYNVTFTTERVDCGQICTLVSNAVAAGDDAYDLVYARLYEAPALVTGGALYNLYDIPYLNLENPWWDQNSVEALELNGKLNLVATDINVNDKDATAAIAFNKSIVKDLGIEDLYQLVKDGKWTFDKMKEIYSSVSRDLNGDSKMTTDDLWGFLGKNDVIAAFYSGSGETMVSKNDEGLFELTYNNERGINATIKILELMTDKANFFNHHVEGVSDTDYTKLFEEGHGLFFWMRLDEVTNMRSAEVDFGILPTPKYEESQDNYYSMVSQHTTGLPSVPKTASDPERTGIILEALAAESKYTLQPAYYEVSLKSRGARDEESAEMLDIIFSNRVFDPAMIYGFDGFLWNFATNANNGNMDVVSAYTKTEKSITKQIEKFNENILEGN